MQGEIVKDARAVVEAQASQAKRFENDRGKLEARLRANDDLRDDALTECDFLREENVRLTREAAEVPRLLAENERMRARLDLIRAEEFRDRVVAEVAEMMPVGGSRPLDEILAGPRELVRRGAGLHKVPLDVDAPRSSPGGWGASSTDPPAPAAHTSDVSTRCGVAVGQISTPRRMGRDGH
ncbi:hypothetical protein MKK63_18730 [Methylobacterium sp. J-088]|uniref:hypothetical protein n=1 Tax=Methylobacterium sp. J-088 TaxID=2836664 RepID=UPI001FBA1EFC|nr:hypothetical protein [Methylobacterium sp. J-088]MCJ2064731.1 hypothetical protein [Methylobacterium sp. J-088]